MTAQPLVIVIAGPNGAGKSTAAARLLPAGITFLNADEIAKGLPNYPSTGADLEAGRILIRQMDDLERHQADFAVETTLASRSLAPRMARLRQSGYLFRLVFVWSPSAEFSIGRVAARVRSGGHAIPEDTIRRRYEAGIKNFFQLYRPLADLWSVHDNTQQAGFRMIAEGRLGGPAEIHVPETWDLMRERGSHA